MSIASYARDYADALDRLEAARSFAHLSWPKDGTVKVTWSIGSACPGYPEMSQEISRIISEQMPELIQQAVANLHSQVVHAHDKLEDAVNLGSKRYMRAGDLKP